MTIVQIKKKQYITTVDDMLTWLKIIKGKYEFTGPGMSVIAFENDLDAIAFSLRFDI